MLDYIPPILDWGLCLLSMSWTGLRSMLFWLHSRSVSENIAEISFHYDHAAGLPYITEKVGRPVRLVYSWLMDRQTSETVPERST